VPSDEEINPFLVLEGEVVEDAIDHSPIISRKSKVKRLDNDRSNN